MPECLAALAWVVYGSFFEWTFHKHWMHTPRSPKEAFRGHTIVHHGLYKGNETYFVPEGEHPEHILLKPYALPLIIVGHMPIMWAIDRYLFHHTFAGALSATITYFVVYEYMHWNMHVPRRHFVERFRWFQFLRTHHHIHHRIHQKNFCVLLPLADAVFGTLETEATLARRKAERESAIARGEWSGRGKPAAREPKRLASLAGVSTGSAIGRSIQRLETRLEARRQRSVADWKRRTAEFRSGRRPR